MAELVLTPEEESALLSLTADYARSISYGDVKPQLLEVLSAIKVAAEQGLTSIEFTDTPHPNLQEELIQRGFQISIRNSRVDNGPRYLEISW